MFTLVRQRIQQYARNQGSEAHVDRILRFADPAIPNMSLWLRAKIRYV